MGHINYNFLLGQVVCLPIGLNGKFEDELIEAVSFDSTLLLDNNLYDMFKFMLGNSSFNNIKSLLQFPQFITIQNSIGLYTKGLGPASKFSYYRYTNCFFLDNLNVTHDHEGIVFATTFNNNFPRVVTYDTPGSDGDYFPIIEKSGELNPTFRFFDSTRGNVIAWDISNIKIESYTNSNLKSVTYNNLNHIRDLRGDDSQMRGLIYKPPFYSQSDAVTPLLIGDGFQCFSQASLGVNMLVIVNVKRNIFDLVDSEYCKKLVGTTFQSLVTDISKLNSGALEIKPLHSVGTLQRTPDYDDLFNYYNIQGNSFNFSLLFGGAANSSDRNKKRALYNAKDIGDITKITNLGINPEIIDNLDIDVKHSHATFTKMPAIDTITDLAENANIQGNWKNPRQVISFPEKNQGVTSLTKNWLVTKPQGNTGTFDLYTSVLTNLESRKLPAEPSNVITTTYIILRYKNP